MVRSREVFGIADRNLGGAEILSCLERWIKDDKSGVLIEVVQKIGQPQLVSGTTLVLLSTTVPWLSTGEQGENRWTAVTRKAHRAAGPVSHLRARDRRTCLRGDGRYCR